MSELEHFEHQSAFLVASSGPRSARTLLFTKFRKLPRLIIQLLQMSRDTEPAHASKSLLRVLKTNLLSGSCTNRGGRGVLIVAIGYPASIPSTPIAIVIFVLILPRRVSQELLLPISSLTAPCIHYSRSQGI